MPTHDDLLGALTYYTHDANELGELGDIDFHHENIKNLITNNPNSIPRHMLGNEPTDTGKNIFESDELVKVSPDSLMRQFKVRLERIYTDVDPERPAWSVIPTDGRQVAHRIMIVSKNNMAISGYIVVMDGSIYDDRCDTLREAIIRAEEAMQL